MTQDKLIYKTNLDCVVVLGQLELHSETLFQKAKQNKTATHLTVKQSGIRTVARCHIKARLLTLPALVLVILYVFNDA